MGNTQLGCITAPQPVRAVMPWTESDAMDQRLQFVTDALSDRFTMTELCARYGVSRRVGYKWLARFNEDGKRGLADRSRRPHTCPTQIRPVLAERLCEFRRLHEDWGPRKLLKALRRRHPEIEDWPAASTAADLLARRGLVRRRPRRRARQHPGVIPIATVAPNDLWTADFKGSSAPATGSTATRSRSPTSIRGSCSRATACSRPRPRRRGRCSSAPSGSTGCRWGSARTTACPSRHWPFTRCRT